MAPTETSTPVVCVRRSAERGFEDFGWTDNWITLGPLRVMVENRIQANPRHDWRGSVAHAKTWGSGST